jgi:hypothetical protein
VSSKVHLVIPDQHACGSTPHTRAIYAGRLIEAVKPDVIVNLGDAADMASLSSYDKGTRGYEGRRYQSDVESNHKFLEMMWSQVSQPTKDKARKVVLEGNHEYRITRATNSDPMLYGTIDYKDLGFEDYYDEVVRYEGSTPGTINIDGITYAHFLASGVMGRPIAGEHGAYSLIAKKFQSCTVGHTHTLDFASRTREDGTRLNGLVAGCYDNNFHGYAGSANKMWWCGLIIKREVHRGDYDLETVSIKRLKKEFKGG